MILIFLIVLVRGNPWGMEVAGTIDTDTTWSINDSPIVLVEEVEIARGTTLIIETGVTVMANSKFESIKVFGVLKAVGTKESKIKFNEICIYGSSSDYTKIHIEFVNINQLDPTYGCDGQVIAPSL